MFKGFELLGTLNEGIGWPQRVESVDAKYSRPLSFSELYYVNYGYLSGLTTSQRHDPHWQDLASELDKEHKLKRVDGSYCLPRKFTADHTTISRTSSKTYRTGTASSHTREGLQHRANDSARHAQDETRRSLEAQLPQCRRAGLHQARPPHDR
eukprot:838522-Amphidinium_carterae.2